MRTGVILGEDRSTVVFSFATEEEFRGRANPVQLSLLKSRLKRDWPPKLHLS